MTYDCVIIGAGPAGMSAAITLADAGVRILVLDRAPRAGGQIFRSAANSPLPDASALGPDYTDGSSLIMRFEACSAEHQSEADVWHVGEDGTILYSKDGIPQQVQTREILLCTGAMERPMPIPGWTLPGVMTAGAAQVMLKSDAVVAKDAIFAGSGPLLYLITAQYLRLGVKVAALVDTTPRRNYLTSLPKAPGALRSWPMLRKGLGLMREIASSGIPVFRGASNLRVLGKGKASGLEFDCQKGQQRVLSEHVFLHHGVIPHSNMSRSMGLSHIWNTAQHCWQVQTDAWGQSSIPHVSVAGDGAGITGADAAQSAGRLSALNILTRLGRLTIETRNLKARKDRATLGKMAPFRRFIDQLYGPSKSLCLPQQMDTTVCRCEERSLKDLKDGFDQGARDPNALKSLTRCGMGPCQGRQCGPIVSSLLADLAPRAGITGRLLPPAKPATAAQPRRAQPLSVQHFGGRRMNADVLIIGGGLQGCSTAYHLAKDGASVIVLEKDYIARHASGVNAGGVRLLGRDLAEVPLSKASMEMWQTLDDTLEEDTGFRRKTLVNIAVDEADIATLKARETKMRALPLRQTTGFAQSLLQLVGVDWAALDFLLFAADNKR